MSKLSIGVGEDFPLDDAPKNETNEHPCAARWRARHMHRGRHFRRRHGPGPVAALFVLPAAAASVTAAILYPLATLGLIGSLGAAGVIYRHSRRNDNDTKPDAKPNPEQK
jgi:hypothetical protein